MASEIEREKPLDRQSRTIISNVHNYFENEANRFEYFEDDGSNYFEKVQERLEDATGMSRRTLNNILNEELHEIENETRKRKRPKKLIIDQNIKISGSVLRARTENIALELRCQDGTEERADALTVPADQYMKRPAAVGSRLQSNVSYKLARLFQRNLGVVGTPPNDKYIEMMVAKGLKVIEEVDEETVRVEVPREPRDVTMEQVDIAELPTQILPTASQGLVAEKRTAEQAELEDAVPAKRPRLGYKSFQKFLKKMTSREQPIIPTEEVSTKERSPEQARRPEGDSAIPQDEILQAVPHEIQEPVNQPPVEDRRVSQMLEAVGLADSVAQAGIRTSERQLRGRDSDSSETLLGSLDRTQVDVGDSDKTTDTQKFLKREWGTQSTMMKILRLYRRGVEPVTLDLLLEFGPVMTGYQSVIAARCFTSLLKLKQYRFVNLTKDDQQKIVGISLGPRIQEISRDL